MSPRRATDVLHNLCCRFFHRHGFLSHLRSLRGYDEPEILPSSTHQICLMSADGGQADALGQGIGIDCTWWDGKMLPDARQVRESYIDHLDLVVLDGLEDVLGSDTVEKHRLRSPSNSGSQMASGTLISPY